MLYKTSDPKTVHREIKKLKPLNYNKFMWWRRFDTKTQSYIIADYKTNKDLLKNYKGKTMIGPFSHLLDNPLNHYVIQLSYYQLLLEQVGVKVSKRVIIWLGLDGNYQLFNTEDVTDILKQQLNN